MERIIDFHTHIENFVPEDHPERRWHRIGAKYWGSKGPAWLWEQFHFHPKMAAGQNNPVLAFLTALEIGFASTRADPLRNVQNHAALGIGRCVTLPIEPPNRSEFCLESARAHPGLIPFACVDPMNAQAEKRLRSLLAAGAKGIKMHPILQQVSPENPAWEKIFRVAREFRVPVLTHGGSFRYYIARYPSEIYGDPSRLANLCRKFPDVPLVVGHMGLVEHEKALKLAEELPNVTLETSFQHRSIIKNALARIGPDRLVFGTDWPNSTIKGALREALAATEGDEDARKAILWGNAERLLGIS